MTPEENKILEREITQYYKELEESQKWFTKIIGKRAWNQLMEYCELRGKIKIVENPRPVKLKFWGKQHIKKIKGIDEIRIDEWSIGIEGDSFNGIINVRIGETWYEIPYIF